MLVFCSAGDVFLVSCITYLACRVSATTPAMRGAAAEEPWNLWLQWPSSSGTTWWEREWEGEGG